MGRILTLIACACTSLVTLSACSPFHSQDHRAAVCNELNSRIIFSGNTSNTRNAEIQNASLPLAQRAYDVNCQND